MQRLWSADELGKRWLLLPEDLALLAGQVDAGKLGLAVQLAFWRQHGRFPNDEADVAPAVVAHLAVQIGVGSRRAGRLRLGGPQRAPAPSGHHRSLRGRWIRRGDRSPVPPLAG
jgi:hypothetical protein